VWVNARLARFLSQRVRDDTDRLERELADRFPASRLIRGGGDIARAVSQVAGFIDAPALELTPVEYRITRQLHRHSHTARRLAVQEANHRVRRIAREFVDFDQGGTIFRDEFTDSGSATIAQYPASLSAIPTATDAPTIQDTTSRIASDWKRICRRNKASC